MASSLKAHLVAALVRGKQARTRVRTKASLLEGLGVFREVALNTYKRMIASIEILTIPRTSCSTGTVLVVVVGALSVAMGL